MLLKILAVVAAIELLFILVSSIFPAWRRFWAFHLIALKYLFLWLSDVTNIRKIGPAVRGEPYRPYSGPELMRGMCEDLGPTFIKFGQIVASSAGLFPKPYVDEFQRVLDRVKPFSLAEVEQTLNEELGSARSRLSDISEKPLASASIAQVHTALLDGDTRVVVKVQRPGLQKRISADMAIMRVAAKIAAKVVRGAELANPVAIVDDFATTLNDELDFRKEAANLNEFNRIMAGFQTFDVRAPKPEIELTTPRVLVMERFFGLRADDAEGIRKSGVDAEAQLVKGLRSWFQCVLFHGFFHGDVHAGNLMLLDDRSVGFLDFGIVGRFSQEQIDLVTDYIITFAMGDYRGLAKVVAKMGGVKNLTDDNLEAFSSDLAVAYGPVIRLSFGDLNYAALLPEIQRVATKHKMTLPREFVLITKQMLYFDRYAKLLAPKLNIFTDARLIMSMQMDVMKARAMREARSAAG